MKYFFVLLLFCVQILPAKTIFVQKGAVGLNDGTSWANAYPELKSALPTALHGDEIWVAQGEYRSLLPGDSSFVLKSGVRLLGGFAGWETESGQRDWVEHVTILSGKGYAPNVIYCAGTDSTTLVDGFTVREGFALPLFGASCDFFPDQHGCHGGGLYLYSGEPMVPTYLTVRNCRFVAHYAGYGGGIAANFWFGSGGLTVKNCYFSNFLPYDYPQGGGIYVSIANLPDVKVLIDSCLFENNRAAVAGAVAISNSGPSSVTISNSSFFQNTGGYNCGAISNQLSGNAAPTSIVNCIFNGNKALENVGSGAAILGRRVNISGCSFVNNSARTGGALNVSTANIENSVFANNKALSINGLTSKAGVAQLGDACLFVNCLFLNNYTDRKGGVFNFASNTTDTIVNCIFVGNSALGGGDWASEIYDFNLVYLNNCYIDTESCDSLPYIRPAQNAGTVTCGSNMYYLDTDPMLLDTAAGQYGLQRCSPLINAGDSTWIMRLGIARDYLGLPRIQDGNVDIGPIEGHFPLAVSTLEVTSSCSEQNNGAISFEMDNACLPLEYQWSDGVNIGTGLSGLGSGAYQFTITDQKGKKLLTSVSIGATMPVTLNSNIVNASASNASNGQIQTNIFSGLLPCQFLWSTGDTTASIVGLLPGLYTLTVTDSVGCWYEFSYPVEYSSKILEPGDQSLIISPNPSAGITDIQLPQADGGTIRFYDNRGQLIETRAIVSEIQRISLDMSQWSAGLYWVVFSDKIGKRLGVAKILVIH